ncbi:hypothetical protein BESB_035860 [Besnoitia besnoiti]|uniref:Uncharacterized protein n=1 Tax=Besnoitia besnoiti TaxID=94643 RepID=A0A2A9MF27_BESBE|nr:hypothetical protein BESB_035860 [Besnoitia besnoiti]PFH37128.1 hypothetical protein BESB_035860 [Besnoitia besnoiti]
MGGDVSADVMAAAAQFRSEDRANGDAVPRFPPFYFEGLRAGEPLLVEGAAARRLEVGDERTQKMAKNRRRMQPNKTPADAKAPNEKKPGASGRQAAPKVSEESLKRAGSRGLPSSQDASWPPFSEASASPGGWLSSSQSHAAPALVRPPLHATSSSPASASSPSSSSSSAGLRRSSRLARGLPAVPPLSSSSSSRPAASPSSASPASEAASASASASLFFFSPCSYSSPALFSSPSSSLSLPSFSSSSTCSAPSVAACASSSSSASTPVASSPAAAFLVFSTPLSSSSPVPSSPSQASRAAAPKLRRVKKKRSGDPAEREKATSRRRERRSGLGEKQETAAREAPPRDAESTQPNDAHSSAPAAGGGSAVQGEARCRESSAEGNAPGERCEASADEAPQTHAREEGRETSAAGAQAGDKNRRESGEREDEAAPTNDAAEPRRGHGKRKRRHDQKVCVKREKITPNGEGGRDECSNQRQGEEVGEDRGERQEECADPSNDAEGAALTRGVSARKRPRLQIAIFVKRERCVSACAASPAGSAAQAAALAAQREDAVSAHSGKELPGLSPASSTRASPPRAAHEAERGPLAGRTKGEGEKNVEKATAQEGDKEARGDGDEDKRRERQANTRSEKTRQASRDRAIESDRPPDRDTGQAAGRDEGAKATEGGDTARLTQSDGANSAPHASLRRDSRHVGQAVLSKREKEHDDDRGKPSTAAVPCPALCVFPSSFRSPRLLPPAAPTLPAALHSSDPTEQDARGEAREAALRTRLPPLCCSASSGAASGEKSSSPILLQDVSSLQQHLIATKEHLLQRLRNRLSACPLALSPLARFSSPVAPVEACPQPPSTLGGSPPLPCASSKTSASGSAHSLSSQSPSSALPYSYSASFCPYTTPARTSGAVRPARSAAPSPPPAPSASFSQPCGSLAASSLSGEPLAPRSPSPGTPSPQPPPVVPSPPAFCERPRVASGERHSAWIGRQPRLSFRDGSSPSPSVGSPSCRRQPTEFAGSGVGDLSFDRALETLQRLRGASTARVGSGRDAADERGGVSDRGRIRDRRDAHVSSARRDRGGEGRQTRRQTSGVLRASGAESVVVVDLEEEEVVERGHAAREAPTVRERDLAASPTSAYPVSSSAPSPADAQGAAQQTTGCAGSTPPPLPLISGGEGAANSCSRSSEPLSAFSSAPIAASSAAASASRLHREVSPSGLLARGVRQQFPPSSCGNQPCGGPSPCAVASPLADASLQAPSLSTSSHSCPASSACPPLLAAPDTLHPPKKTRICFSLRKLPASSPLLIPAEYQRRREALQLEAEEGEIIEFSPPARKLSSCVSSASSSASPPSPVGVSPSSCPVAGLLHAAHSMKTTPAQTGDEALTQGTDGRANGGGGRGGETRKEGGERSPEEKPRRHPAAVHARPTHTKGERAERGDARGKTGELPSHLPLPPRLAIRRRELEEERVVSASAPDRDVPEDSLPRSRPDSPISASTISSARPSGSAASSVSASLSAASAFSPWFSPSSSSVCFAPPLPPPPSLIAQAPNGSLALSAPYASLASLNPPLASMPVSPGSVRPSSALSPSPEAATRREARGRERATRATGHAVPPQRRSRREGSVEADNGETRRNAAQPPRASLRCQLSERGDGRRRGVADEAEERHSEQRDAFTLRAEASRSKGDSEVMRRTERLSPGHAEPGERRKQLNESLTFLYAQFQAEAARSGFSLPDLLGAFGEAFIKTLRGERRRANTHPEATALARRADLSPLSSSLSGADSRSSLSSLSEDLRALSVSSAGEAERTDGGRGAQWSRQRRRTRRGQACAGLAGTGDASCTSSATDDERAEAYLYGRRRSRGRGRFSRSLSASQASSGGDHSPSPSVERRRNAAGKENCERQRRERVRDRRDRWVRALPSPDVRNKGGSVSGSDHEGASASRSISPYGSSEDDSSEAFSSSSLSAEELGARGAVSSGELSVPKWLAARGSRAKQNRRREAGEICRTAACRVKSEFVCRDDAGRPGRAHANHASPVEAGEKTEGATDSRRRPETHPLGSTDSEAARRLRATDAWRRFRRLLARREREEERRRARRRSSASAASASLCVPTPPQRARGADEITHESGEARKRGSSEDRRAEEEPNPRLRGNPHEAAGGEGSPQHVEDSGLPMLSAKTRGGAWSPAAGSDTSSAESKAANAEAQTHACERELRMEAQRRDGELRASEARGQVTDSDRQETVAHELEGAEEPGRQRELARADEAGRRGRGGDTLHLHLGGDAYLLELLLEAKPANGGLSFIEKLRALKRLKGKTMLGK